MTSYGHRPSSRRLSPQVFRTVIESNEYTREVFELADSFARVHQVHDAVTWELARRPEAGEPIMPDSAYRLYKTSAIGNTPSFTVLYLYDAAGNPNEVLLMSIRANDHGE